MEARGRTVARRMELAHVSDRLLAKIAVTAAVLALVIAFAGRALQHDRPYMMVDELVTKGPGKYVGREVAVHGFVEPDGELRRARVPIVDRRFVLGMHGTRIRVHFRGLWPDNVRPQSEVVVHGHLTFDGNGWVIEATKLLSRCGGTYRSSDDLDTIYK
jgi:cytochrome c-type biogenesis protein CcmE